MNDYFNVTSVPTTQSRGTSSTVRAEYAAIAAGFDKMPTLAKLWGGNQNYVVAGGVVDVWTATLAATYLTSYVDGMQLRVKFAVANTSATPTINLNAIGAKIIATEAGAALGAGDIVAGQIATLTYSSTSGKFQLAGSAAVSSAVAAAASAAAAAQSASDAAASALAAATSASAAATSASASAASATGAAASLAASQLLASGSRVSTLERTGAGPWSLAGAVPAVTAVTAMYVNGQKWRLSNFSINVPGLLVTYTPGAVTISSTSLIDIEYV